MRHRVSTSAAQVAGGEAQVVGPVAGPRGLQQVVRCRRTTWPATTGTKGTMQERLQRAGRRSMPGLHLQRCPRMRL